MNRNDIGKRYKKKTLLRECERERTRELSKACRFFDLMRNSMAWF